MVKKKSEIMKGKNDKLIGFLIVSLMLLSIFSGAVSADAKMEKTELSGANESVAITSALSAKCDTCACANVTEEEAKEINSNITAYYPPGDCIGIESDEGYSLITNTEQNFSNSTQLNGFPFDETLVEGAAYKMVLSDSGYSKVAVAEGKVAKAGDGPAAPGSRLYEKWTLSNYLGDENMTNVKVEVLAYQYTTFTGWFPVTTGTVAFDDEKKKATWDIGTLYAKKYSDKNHPSAATCEWTTRVDCDLPYTLKNIPASNMTTYCDQRPPKTETLASLPLHPAPLSIGKWVKSNGKWVEESEALPGDILTFVIGYKNIGYCDCSDVVIFDPIPPFTTYVEGSATTDRGTVTYDGVSLRWKLGTLKPFAYISSGDWNIPPKLNPPPECSGYVYFQVKIDENFPPTSINNSAVSYCKSKYLNQPLIESNEVKINEGLKVCAGFKPGLVPWQRGHVKANLEVTVTYAGEPVEGAEVWRRLRLLLIGRSPGIFVPHETTSKKIGATNAEGKLLYSERLVTRYDPYNDSRYYYYDIVVQKPGYKAGKTKANFTVGFSDSWTDTQDFKEFADKTRQAATSLPGVHWLFSLPNIIEDIEVLESEEKSGTDKYYMTFG